MAVGRSEFSFCYIICNTAFQKVFLYFFFLNLKLFYLYNDKVKEVIIKITKMMAAFTYSRRFVSAGAQYTGSCYTNGIVENTYCSAFFVSSILIWVPLWSIL